jgi:cytochrome c553
MRLHPALPFILALVLAAAPLSAREDARSAAQQVEAALRLTPDPDRGREVYHLCAVCHMPEGWGQGDGTYPQIAGQHFSVIIKQLADIRARNRDTPTMLPFTMLEHLELQDITDVAAYVTDLPMAPENGVGPGDDLAHGEALYERYCVDCHGAAGEGIAREQMPLIQGQHFRYLVRQFEWLRDGKRRNGDREMLEQARSFSDRDIAAVMDYVSRLRPPPQRVEAPDWTNPDFPGFVRPQITNLGSETEGL